MHTHAHTHTCPKPFVCRTLRLVLTNFRVCMLRSHHGLLHQVPSRSGWGRKEEGGRGEGGRGSVRDSLRQREESLLAAKAGLNPTGLTMAHGLLPKKREALLPGGDDDESAAHASGGRRAGAEAPPAPSTNSGSFADAARSTRTRIVDTRGRGGKEKEGGGYSPPSSRP